MVPYIVIMNSSIQVQPVSPLHGMMKSSEKSTFNTRQDRRMISSAKSEKEKTTNSTSATQGEHVTADQFKKKFPKSAQDNHCIKKFDHRLIYNYN